MASQRTWYKFCVHFRQLGPAGQLRGYQSKKTRATFTRIALLHPTWGEALDKAGAPLRCHVFVAYAPNEPNAPRNHAQRMRYETLARFYEQRGKWPLPWQLALLRIKVWEQLNGRVAAPVAAPAAPVAAAATRGTAPAAPAAPAPAAPAPAAPEPADERMKRILAVTLVANLKLRPDALGSVTERLEAIAREFGTKVA